MALLPNTEYVVHYKPIPESDFIFQTNLTFLIALENQQVWQNSEKVILTIPNDSCSIPHVVKPVDVLKPKFTHTRKRKLRKERLERDDLEGDFEDDLD